MRCILGLYFPTNTCNLECEYCYVHKENNEMNWIPYSQDEIREAFSVKRLGDSCLINISSNGEPLMNRKMITLIKKFCEMGHYLMILTNGTLMERFDEILTFPEELLERIFFKFSYHYEELVKKNKLEDFFYNINRVKQSAASFSVELMASDTLLDKVDEIKKRTINNIAALPHISIPRDEQQATLGVYSKYSSERFMELWSEKGFHSEFFEFKRNTWGKHVDWFCYAGERSVSINMGNGEMRQCYHTPPIQNFFDMSKPIQWLPVGRHCCEAHCYVSHMFMPLGVVEPPVGISNVSYYTVRNRKGIDLIDWVKPKMREIFEQGVFRDEISERKKVEVDKENDELLYPGKKREAILLKILKQWLENRLFSKKISEYFQFNEYSEIALYGYGDLGQMFLLEAKQEHLEVKYVIDRNAENFTRRKSLDIPIINPEEEFKPVDVMIITPIEDFFTIKDFCKSKISCHVLSIEEVIYGIQKMEGQVHEEKN